MKCSRREERQAVPTITEHADCSPGHNSPRRIMRSIFLYGSLIVSAALAAGCDESLSKLAGPSPNLQPTFSAIQATIFEQSDSSGRAACTNCHTNAGGRPPSGGLNLAHDVAYDQLVNVVSREKSGVLYVAPGNSDGSYLIQKLVGAPGIVGRQMPFSGPPFLTDGQLLIIRRWIDSGAPRN